MSVQLLQTEMLVSDTKLFQKYQNQKSHRANIHLHRYKNTLRVKQTYTSSTILLKLQNIEKQQNRISGTLLPNHS